MLKQEVHLSFFSIYINLTYKAAIISVFINFVQKENLKL